MPSGCHFGDVGSPGRAVPESRKWQKGGVHTPASCGSWGPVQRLPVVFCVVTHGYGLSRKDGTEPSLCPLYLPVFRLFMSC